MCEKTRNYLRIYANLSKENYSESEKESLVKTLISIGETIFQQSDLRMDINGSGYGISKGDPLVKQATFWKKINQKGYKNLLGISASDKDETYQSQFNLWTPKDDFWCLDIEFFWQNANDFDNEKAQKIIETWLPITRIDYAYGYRADKKLTWNEWITKKSFWSSTSYIPKDEDVWQEKISEIPNGSIKKIYDFNVLNTAQMANVSLDNKQVSPLSENLTIVM